LPLTGERAEAGIAFMRGNQVITVAPIRPVAIDRNGWGDTAAQLPRGKWSNVLTSAGLVDGGRGAVSLAELTGDR